MTGSSAATVPPPLVEPLYERGRRGKWVGPVLLAFAGLGLVALIVLTTFAIPSGAYSAEADSTGGRKSAVAVVALATVALAILGTSLGARGMRRIDPLFHPAATGALTALAGLALVSVPTFVFVGSTVAARGEPSHVFDYLTALWTAIGVACAILAILRWRRVRIAAVYTPAFALVTLLIFPFGTAASLAWLFWLRRRETSAI